MFAWAENICYLCDVKYMHIVNKHADEAHIIIYKQIKVICIRAHD